NGTLAERYGLLVERWVPDRILQPGDADDEADVDRHSGVARRSGKAGPWTLARLAERLAENKGKPEEVLSLVHEALKAQAHPSQPYAEYVNARALALEKSAKPDMIADALLRAFPLRDPTAKTWHTDVRKKWAQLALLVAARSVTQADGRQKAKQALDYCRTTE